MARVIQIALHGINVLENTDPDNFALYADQSVDYILIKEKARGTVNIASSGNQPISHGLSYVPFCLVFVEISTGVWKKIYSADIDGSGIYFYVTDTELKIYNDSGAKNFAYFIFYDNIT